MISALLSLAAGFLAFFGLLLVFEPNAKVRRFWVSRVVTAVALGIILWKVTPIWTRSETVFANLTNPAMLLSMNGGLSALLGGLFAFVTVVLLSLFQVRREVPGTRRWSLLVPVASALIVVGAWTLLEPVVVPRPGSDPGPAVQALVPDLEGRQHALADWRGKVVVVNFWATWCPPCLAELPEFQRFTQTSSGKVVVVGANLLSTEKEGERGVVRFAAKNKLNWTQLTDPGILQAAFEVTSIPTTVVLDPDGRVVDRRVGAVDLFWLRTLEARFAR